MNRVELKEKAKQSLQGKYNEAIKLFAMAFLVAFVVSIALGVILGLFNASEDVSGIISEVVSLLITSMLGFGQISFFLKISRNEDVTYMELFSKTKMVWLYLGISLVSSIIAALWTIVFIIPGIIASIAYSQALLIALDNPDIGIIDAISKSKEMMKGYKMEYFILNLSFIGWIILGIFTFGIGYLWLMPYITVTQCNFYNHLKNANK